MQLRFIKRLLRLDAHRHHSVPAYQQHQPLAVVVDSQGPRHLFRNPHQPLAQPPLDSWWRAFGGELSPHHWSFGLMFTGHHRPGSFGLLGQPATNSYIQLLRQGRSLDGQRLAVSRLRRLSHLHNPLPPELALTTTHPLQRRRWRSAALRQGVPSGLLKRSEARRLQEQKELGQQQRYMRWMQEAFGKEGKQLLKISGSRQRPERHFAAQPRRGYQLHYAGYQPTTPLWVYAGGLRPHLAPLTLDRRWWRRLQRREKQPRPRSFWNGYAGAGQRLLRRERWLQLRLERYPLPLLRSRFEQGLTMARRSLLVAEHSDPEQPASYPKFWNRWTTLRHYLGRQWRQLQRFFNQKYSLRQEPLLLALQLGVDFHLLQLNLATLQRQELLEPQAKHFAQQRALLEPLLKQSDANFPAVAAQLRRELRQRSRDRGLFGALLEPLLLGRSAEGRHNRAGLGLSRPSALPVALRDRGFGQRPQRSRQRQRLQRRLGHWRERWSPNRGLLLPRPLGRGQRRLGFGDFLAETLGLDAGSAATQRRLGRESGAARRLLQPSETALNAQNRRLQPSPLTPRSTPSTDAAAEELRQRWAHWRQQSGALLPSQNDGLGQRREDRLRSGALGRGAGMRQICLRGRREGLLSGYLNVETDLHPFRGWPMDYHLEQCWDFLQLDSSILPAATLERLGLTLEELAPELRNYLKGSKNYYRPDQLQRLAQLRGRAREDYEKQVVAELKKLCPPVAEDDRLDMHPIWQPGLDWWRPRYVAQAAVFQGRPRRRCTHGTNLGARAPARLYQRVFLPRLMGALEGDYKILQQLMPYTLHHPYSYRWRRLRRQRRNYGLSLERFLRWGPRYGRRLNWAMRLGRPLKPRLRRRLGGRPPQEETGEISEDEEQSGDSGDFALPSRDWRLRLQQLRERLKWQRRRNHSLSWMNHPITRVRTDARANLVTGVISHMRWSYTYVLRRRKVKSYRRHRRQQRRLDLRLRRWRWRRAAALPSRELQRWPLLKPYRPQPWVSYFLRPRLRRGQRPEPTPLAQRRRRRRFALLRFRLRRRLLPRRRYHRRRRALLRRRRSTPREAALRYRRRYHRPDSFDRVTPLNPYLVPQAPLNPETDRS